MPKETAEAVRVYVQAHPEPYTFSFNRGERKVFHKRQPVAVSLWAEKHRVLTMSSVPGRWKNVFTPYLRGIMDTMGTKGVETVIICKSPQAGGSEASHNFVGYCIDRAPGPVMYVFPDELTARENAHDRIIPMIKSSPRLREYLSDLDDDTSSIRITLVHMPIYLAWSGSVSRLGNKPVRTLILDELDKYQNGKREASAESLAEKRTTTWRSQRKIIKISTPTTENGPIWTAFTKEANCRMYYWVKCPHCGAMQVMVPEQLTWPRKGEGDEPDAEAVMKDKSAGYACSSCGAVWSDADRDLAVRAGEWREEETGEKLRDYVRVHRPVKVGFHITALMSYFVSLSETARAAIKAKSGDLAALKDYNTQYLAIPWKEPKKDRRSRRKVLRLCDDRPRGLVPSPLPETPDTPRISCLLAGIDTQKDDFRYVVRAFGYGPEEESWLIECGALKTFEEIEEKILARTFVDAKGTSYHVHAVMMDAMGSRTAEVYRFAHAHRGQVYPWQGKRSMSTPWAPTNLEFYPGLKGQQVRITGGLILYRCDTTFFKSALAHKLELTTVDPGAFHLHENTGNILKQYAEEMSAEEWDYEKNAWVTVSDHADNHFWDCETMIQALAYIRGVRNIPLPGTQPAQVQRPRPVQRPVRRHVGRY